MTLLLPIVAALVSLLIVPGWSFSFDVTPKVVVALMGAAVALVLTRQTPAPATDNLKWFAILAGAQGVTMVLATLFSTHPWVSVMGSAWRRTGLLAEIAVLFLAVIAAGHFAAGSSRLRLWLHITVLAALPAAVYGVAQYFGIDPWMNPAGYHFGEGAFTIVRPPSTLGHAAYFATYLLYAVFAGAALALSETSLAWRTCGLAVSGLSCFAIVLSGTRAAVAGLVAGALFLLIRRSVDWRWVAGAVALLVLLGGFYFSPAGGRLRARVFWSSEDARGGARLLLWRDTLRMTREHWMVGYGPETFAREFPRHQSLELARAFPDFYHESAHNIFLDALVSKGVLGLLPLIALAIFGLTMARGPIGAAFVAMLVSQQFTAFTLPTELYFYMSLAILVSACTSAGVSTVRARPWQWAAALPFAGMALVLAAGDAWLGSARRALDRGDIQGAARALDHAHDWRASADLYFSRRFWVLSAGDLHAWLYGMSAAARAPRTADDPQNAWVNLAAFYATQNNAADVEKSLRAAIAAAPNWFKPHWLLAQVLARDGRLAEAETEARAAVERDGGKDPEVTRTWEQLRAR